MLIQRIAWYILADEKAFRIEICRYNLLLSMLFLYCGRINRKRHRISYRVDADASLFDNVETRVYTEKYNRFPISEGRFGNIIIELF